MRRSGKSTFLWQCLADRLRHGSPRSDLVTSVSRTNGLPVLQPADLAWLSEEYYRLRPGARDTRIVTFCFDEIQMISGWEAFVRRAPRHRKVQLFISGSSARLLSREVASSMRGRALEVLVHPFSFREAPASCRR